MQSEPQTAPASKAMIWTGRVMSALPALFLLFGGVMNLAKPDFVVQGTMKYGYPESVIVPLGIVVIACTVIYLIPRTAVLGAILLTGYLGGAVATHVRADEGWFAILFPVFFGALLWGGLVLRDAKLRALLPWRW
jgi:DoxX-like family